MTLEAGDGLLIMWRFAGRRPPRVIAGLLAATLLSGCASTTGGPLRAGPETRTAAPAGAPTHSDPLEDMNRRLFHMGSWLDRALVQPVIDGYRKLAPRPVRSALHNIRQNADEPLVFVNDVLQIRPRAALRTALRFAGNTTVGLAGVFDPAARIGLAHHDNGFGSTLGRYGVAAGPFVYLPLFGATTLRDAVGSGVDFVTDPLSFARFGGARTFSVARTGIELLDDREQADDDLRTLHATSADPYATVRSVYLQSRDVEIKGPDAPLQALPEIPADPEAGLEAPQAVPAPDAHPAPEAAEPVPPPPTRP